MTYLVHTQPVQNVFDRRKNGDKYHCSCSIAQSLGTKKLDSPSCSRFESSSTVIICWSIRHSAVSHLQKLFPFTWNSQNICQGGRQKLDSLTFPCVLRVGLQPPFSCCTESISCVPSLDVSFFACIGSQNCLTLKQCCSIQVLLELCASVFAKNWIYLPFKKLVRINVFKMFIKILD